MWDQRRDGAARAVARPRSLRRRYGVQERGQTSELRLTQRRRGIDQSIDVTVNVEPVSG